jgi:hypothetical protein
MTSMPIMVRQDFTSDHALLLRTLDSLQAENKPSTPEVRLASLDAAVKMISVLQGKKILVYLVDPGVQGLPQTTLQPTINAAIRGNVAIYPIDVRGLVQK